jgi:histidinol-phosphate aminotransferase
VASNNFPFWNCLGKRCAALPFVYVASHTALRAPCTAFAQAAPKREVITRHILREFIMSRYWGNIVHDLTPYVPGEQLLSDSLIKLNTNESPYPPSPLVLDAMHQALGAQGEALRRYPEPTGRVLREAVANRYGVQCAQVFVGNGSDEVLAHVFFGLLKHQGKPLLFPDVTYAFYKVYCALYGIEYRTVALNAQFQIELSDYEQSDAGAIIVANPNAPTGHAVALADIEKLLQACPEKMVVIDEAYVDFGAESAVGLVAHHPNLLVVQTLSKSRSLAGLRVGFAVGQRHLIDGLVRIKDSFNSYPVGCVAQAGAAAAMLDVGHFETTRQAVIRSRENFAQGLKKIGFQVLPSQTNFLFVQHPLHAAQELVKTLRSAGILVRHFSQPARIENFMRITVGTDEQCERVLAALSGKR